MPKNIEQIRIWDDNPDKSRVSNIVRLEFAFPCTWTVLGLDDLETIIRLWIKGEEMRYPPDQGYKGRWMLFDHISRIFHEVE